MTCSKKTIVEYYVRFPMIFFLNIPMSFNLWNFTFDKLCDLKNLKKLISGSCPTPIIQYYINDLKYIIYMSMIYKKCTVVCIFFLLIYFAIYNYLLFFESDHIWFQHHLIHMRVHPIFSFTVLKNWKTKDTLLKRTRRCVGCPFLRNFWMYIYFLNVVIT